MKMKRLIHIALVGIWVALASAGTDATTGRVRFVIDGDTIILADGRTVRYIGIDAPEIDHDDQRAQPFAYEARRFNEKLVGGSPVRLEFDRERRDRYGRILAHIFTADGRLVTEAILASGFAHVFPKKPNLKYGERLLSGQRTAMERGVGKWQNGQGAGEAYIGNRNSRRFHRPDCPFAQRITGKNRVSFTSRYTAFYAGYAPCRACLGAGW
ncbi:MAG: thermonuclease family protein [Desulfobacterales bacterium]|nr:thermonuclease family protein [Desulfobacterales bacterium]